MESIKEHRGIHTTIGTYLSSNYSQFEMASDAITRGSRSFPQPSERKKEKRKERKEGKRKERKEGKKKGKKRGKKTACVYRPNSEIRYLHLHLHLAFPHQARSSVMTCRFLSCFSSAPPSCFIFSSSTFSSSSSPSTHLHPLNPLNPFHSPIPHPP